MSYVWELSRVALDGLRAMPLWLQEETIEELDRLSHDPASLKRRAATPSVVHDFTRPEGGSIHYVFLTLAPDDARGVLGIADLGHFVRAGS